jgi:hypothetical protein
MRPDLSIPSPAMCLDKNYEDFTRFREDPLIPKAIRDRVIGFVLDDVFKCVKQSGVTSAVFPTEKMDASGLRTGGEPVQVSEIGGTLAAIINNVSCFQRDKA